MIELSSRRRSALQYLTWITYGLATVQVVRFYMATVPGIVLEPYLQGTAPLPFQKRYLPALLVRAMMRIGPLVRFLSKHHQAFSSPATGCVLILGGISLSIAGYFCVKLYRAVTLSGDLSFLVYPLFLVCALVSYAVHVERNTNLPYDLPSLAFFTAGIYVIYTRQFLPLFFIVLVGTLNRETTVFLVLLYLIDHSSEESTGLNHSWREDFSLSGVPWLRAALLFATWAIVEGFLSHHFADNDSRHAHVRVLENLHRLKPENFPALLNICGYLLPFVLLFQPAIRPRRFGNYALILIPWLAVMFCYGILTETRIYGELVSYVTVAVVLLMERHLREDRGDGGAITIP